MSLIIVNPSHKKIQILHNKFHNRFGRKIDENFHEVENVSWQ